MAMREIKLQKLRARIVKRRENGETAAEIGLYARHLIGQFKISALDLMLTAEETRMAQPLLPEIVRHARRAEKALRQEEEEARNPKVELPKRKSLTAGLSTSQVRAALGCTLTELNRWSGDQRLPPDGEKFFHGVGPRGGSRWGRAWLPETVGQAKNQIDIWREQDSSRKIFKRRGLKVVS